MVSKPKIKAKNFDIFKFYKEEVKDRVVTRNPKDGFTLVRVWNPKFPKRIEFKYNKKYLVFDCKFDFVQAEEKKINKCFSHELEIPSNECLNKWKSQIIKFKLEKEEVVNVIIYREKGEKYVEYYVMMLDLETYGIALEMVVSNRNFLRRLVKKQAGVYLQKEKEVYGHFSKIRREFEKEFPIYSMGEWDKVWDDVIGYLKKKKHPIFKQVYDEWLPSITGKKKIKLPKIK